MRTLEQRLATDESFFEEIVSFIINSFRHSQGSPDLQELIFYFSVQYYQCHGEQLRKQMRDEIITSVVTRIQQVLQKGGYHSRGYSKSGGHRDQKKLTKLTIQNEVENMVELWVSCFTQDNDPQFLGWLLYSFLERDYEFSGRRNFSFVHHYIVANWGHNLSIHLSGSACITEMYQRLSPLFNHWVNIAPIDAREELLTDGEEQPEVVIALRYMVDQALKGCHY